MDYLEISLTKGKKKINKFCLETIGDISWPEHVAIFTLPIRIALKEKIRLIIWGENLKLNMEVQRKIQKRIF